MASPSAAMVRLTKGSWSPAICASAQSWSARGVTEPSAPRSAQAPGCEGAGSARQIRGLRVEGSSQSFSAHGVAQVELT